MKMIKKLTKTNGTTYGIQAAPEYDFSDDGNKFRGFIYKGLPMTQCYADGVCYLDIRVDYLKTNFTYSEWMATDEYQLCDEFNGTGEEFDIEKLVENLEKILAKVNEMNQDVKISKDELEGVKNITFLEVQAIESFLNNVRTNFKWWTAKSYILTTVADYCNSLENLTRRGWTIINTLDTMEVKAKKEYIEKAKRAINNCKYKILGGDFYMEQISNLTGIN